MKVNFELNMDEQSGEVRQIIKDSLEVIGQLSNEKVDFDKTKIYINNENAVCIDVIPLLKKAQGIDMVIYTPDDIIVGVSHGAHEHFDKSYTGHDVAKAALERFRDLLFSEQTTFIKLKNGKPYSYKTIFVLNGKEIHTLKSTALLISPFSAATEEKIVFSFL